MTEKTPDTLRARLRPVMELLNKHRLVEALLKRQQSRRQELVESVLARQQREEMRRRLRTLPAADIAHLLEMLPPEDRLLVWAETPVEQAGEVLSEAADTVGEHLVANTERERLFAVCAAMDPYDLQHVAELIPEELLAELSARLDPEERRWLEVVESYPEDTVAHLMARDMLTIAKDASLKEALRSIRRLGEVPDQTDMLFVTDAEGHLVGALPLTAILLHRPRSTVGDIMDTEGVSFAASDAASTATQAFERYDLVSAPVVDAEGRLLGRLTVDVVMDFARERAEEEAFHREGLRGDEDLFGPLLTSARRRWLWLFVNLTTAFLASRVIGLFEGTIEQLVAIATLMPIVASIGGNTGNQTIALVVRGLALEQVTADNTGYLTVKELGISLVNGLIWGSLIGAVVYLLYADTGLALVMGAATLLNLVVAAAAGIAVPLGLAKLGRDPAMGASVLLTFTTDGMGFFIFLGLATVFLVA